MGCWNGVGGKLEPGEQPRQSMIRELREETGLIAEQLLFKGLMTWTLDGERFGGMYVYLAEFPVDFHYAVPVKTTEGILDWKELSWITHPENRGVAANLPGTLPTVLEDAGCYQHHFNYVQSRLQSSASMAINPAIETDALRREAFLRTLEAETVARQVIGQPANR